MSKREELKDKVVALVKEFVKTEGEITFFDLESLFGASNVYPNEVIHALVDLPIYLSKP